MFHSNLDKKNFSMKQKILGLCASCGNYSLADLSKELNTSIPTITKVVGELIDDGFLMDMGKIDTNGGRRPSIFGLNPSAGYLVGINERNNGVSIAGTDFKGEFKMQDGNYCFPLDIIDDCSRYVIKIKPSVTTANLVLPTFREVFYEFGMPNSILSDNGAQFAGFKHGFTQFEKWLMNHDVLPIHGRIKHPQTQGKIERFHRAMKQELLSHYVPTDIADAERVLNVWRDCYNNERPHEALGMKCPSEIYVPSNRTYNDTVEKYEYGGQYHVIKVNSWGFVRFADFQIYLSETMIGEYIEFRPNLSNDSFIACYRNFAIAEFDALSGELLHRKISRL